MSRLIIFIFLTTFIFPSDSQSESIPFPESSLCLKDKYVMSLYSTQSFNITLNRTRLKQLSIHTVRIRTSILDPKVATFEDHRSTTTQILYLMNNTEQYNDSSAIFYNSKIYGNYINQTYIQYFIEAIDMQNRIYHINCSVILLVSSPQRMIDKIFKISVPCIIMLISIQMGILLDIEVLKEILRRPIQPLIGFICQYGFMPLIAFSISKIFRYQPIYGLGIFVFGCCPGGSQSNQWTIVFDGDLNLSALMSLTSICASFFMMPLWLYTLGQYAYLRELKIKIPLYNLLRSLLVVIGPLALGMVIAHFIPKSKPFMHRIIKPALIILMVYFFSFSLIVHFYLFAYVDLITALSSPFLPWSGFLLGATFAWICNQDRKRIITIGIETGLQNIGIAVMVLYYSFPSPQNAQASVIPMIISYLSVAPFFLILICQFIYRKCSKPKEELVHNIPADTLNKASRQLSEIEEELLDDTSQTEPVSIPLSILEPKKSTEI